LAAATGILHPDHVLYARIARRAFYEKLRDIDMDMDGMDMDGMDMDGMDMDDKDKDEKSLSPSSLAMIHELGDLCLSFYRALQPHAMPSLAHILVRRVKVEVMTMRRNAFSDEEKTLSLWQEALKATSVAFGTDSELFREAVALFPHRSNKFRTRKTLLSLTTTTMTAKDNKDF